jgi:hypothetical protein
MIKKDELFKIGDHKRIWQKYCGFFDLSLAEFMEIQEQLLMEQIELVHESPLARKLMPRKPEDVSDFRKIVPFTTFDDYAAYFKERNEEILPVKPYFWASTSGRGGTPKFIPYTEKAAEMSVISSITLMILACTTQKGAVEIDSGVRVLHNLPPRPYITGTLLQLMPQILDMNLIPPPDKYENADFQARIQAGFELALSTGVDFLSSLTAVLIKMGESFTESSGKLKFNRHMLHPNVMIRLIRALLRAKREGRTLLPKDLWPLKGLACYGMDTAIYREKLKHYWGKIPLETYASTETAVIATQAWNKKYMTFIPSSCFLEFAPEGEWLKSRESKDYQPATVLLDEVEPGQYYEVIITSFQGMPFLRYRLGDLIKIVALEDEEAGIKLPQMVFESRADGLIDFVGFPRLDEKTVWQAIANTGLKHEDWSARKENEQNQPIIRIYIELKEKMEAKEVERLIHQELIAINRDYEDLESTLGIQPLRVTILPAGSFKRYYERKKASGADLAHLKPPHMNASDVVIQDFLEQANIERP